MNNLIKNILKIFSSKTLTMLTGIISAMLLSRSLSLEDYGTYSQVILVVTISISVFSLGLPYSINYFMGGEITDKNKFVPNFYSLISILFLINFIILFLFGEQVSNLLNNENLIKFTYMLVVLPFSKVIAQSLDNLLVVEKKTNLLITFRVGKSLALLLVVIFIFFNSISFGFFMAFYTIVEVLFLLASLYIIKIVLKYKLINIDFIRFKNILKFSIPVGLSSIIWSLNIQLDKLMVSLRYDVELVGIYTNASRELPFTILVSAVSAVLIPEISKIVNNKFYSEESKYSSVLSVWHDTIKFTTIFLILFSVISIVFAREIITLLYSEKFLLGTNVFIVYAILLIFRVTYFPLIVFTKGMTKTILNYSLYAFLFNILFNILLGLIFGYIGFSIASVLSILFINILYLIKSSNIMGIKFKLIFPWKTYFNIFIVNILLGFAFYLLKNYFLTYYINNNIIIFICILPIWLTTYYFIFKKQLNNYFIHIFKEG